MTQKLVNFLLVVFYYPFLPMKSPGTSYAPSVAAAREAKERNNILWVLVWYFSLNAIAMYYGESYESAAPWVIVFFLICFFSEKDGLVVVVAAIAFGLLFSQPLLVLVAVTGFLLHLGVRLIVVGLMILEGSLP